MESLLRWPTEDAAELRRTDIVRWWEARRLHFYVYVGVVGVIAWFLVLIAASAAVKPGEDFEEPFVMIFGPVIYAFFANACYTLVGLRIPQRGRISSSAIPISGILKQADIVSPGETTEEWEVSTPGATRKFRRVLPTARV